MPTKDERVYPRMPEAKRQEIEEMMLQNFGAEISCVTSDTWIAGGTGCWIAAFCAMPISPKEMPKLYMVHCVADSGRVVIYQAVD